MRKKTTPLYSLRSLQNHQFLKLSAAGITTVENLLELLSDNDIKLQVRLFLETPPPQLSIIEHEAKMLMPEYALAG